MLGLTNIGDPSLISKQKDEYILTHIYFYEETTQDGCVSFLRPKCYGAGHPRYLSWIGDNLW